MNIRRATLKDAEILSALNYEVQKLHADAHPQTFKQPDGPNFTLEYMRAQLDDPHKYFFILSTGGDDIGYIFAMIWERPGNALLHPSKQLYIDQITIKKKYHRMGYGKRLLEEIFAVARSEKIESIILDVWAFNQQSLSFFKKNGFSELTYRMGLDDI